MTPIPDKGTLDLITHSAAQTRGFGVRLAQLAQPGDIFCLEGDLGAGKTCLAQGIGAGLGIREPITSPTFVMVSEHKVPGLQMRFYHIDLYRLDSEQDAFGLGLEEYLYDDGICVVEWPERALGLMPDERLWIRLQYLDENRRSLTVRASGARYEELLGQLGTDPPDF